MEDHLRKIKKYYLKRETVNIIREETHYMSIDNICGNQTKY